MPARAAGTDSDGSEPMKPGDLEKAILEYPLPMSTLCKMGNALFIIRSVGTALRLFSLLPFRAVRGLFPRPGGSSPNLNLERAAISYSLTEYLLRAPLFPFARTCLRRSLLLSHLFRRSGIMVGTAFGVDPAESGWEGHSWLVLEGKPFLETEEEGTSFLPIFHLPAEHPEGVRRRRDGNQSGA